MGNLSSNKNCENCGTLITQKYGSGRFCSEYCARSFSSKEKRQEINKKVSETFKKRWKENPKQFKSFRLNGLKGTKAMAKKNHENHLKRKVAMGSKEDRIYLDITYGELEEYRKLHPVCEICGKPERTITSSKGKVSRLSIDHIHYSNHFRGLLCNSCNRILGYYEKNKENIEQYLNEKGRDYI